VCECVGGGEIGVLEYWSTGVMGYGLRVVNGPSYSTPTLQYSITSLLHYSIA